MLKYVSFNLGITEKWDWHIGISIGYYRPIILTKAHRSRSVWWTRGALCPQYCLCSGSYFYYPNIFMFIQLWYHILTRGKNMNIPPPPILPSSHFRWEVKPVIYTLISVICNYPFGDVHYICTSSTRYYFIAHAVTPRWRIVLSGLLWHKVVDCCIYCLYLPWPAGRSGRIIHWGS